MTTHRVQEHAMLQRLERLYEATGLEFPKEASPKDDDKAYFLLGVCATQDMKGLTLRAFDDALKENPDNFLFYDDIGSPYWLRIDALYRAKVVPLSSRADTIRTAIRQFLGVTQLSLAEPYRLDSDAPAHEKLQNDARDSGVFHFSPPCS